MEKEKLIELLDKYHRGELTKEEKDVFSQWFNSLGKDISDPLPTQSLEKEWTTRNWKQLANTIQEEVIHTHTVKKVSHQSMWAAAASIIMVLGISIWYYSSFYAKDMSNGIQKEQSTAFIEKTNSTLTDMNFTLEDGSMILLQPGSRIKYPIHFQSKKREVILEGEAFFEVAKDPNKPFFVYTGDVITRVLGTSFTIKAYESQPNIQVSVKTGRVSVFTDTNRVKNNKSKGTPYDPIVLTPNQQVTYSIEKKELTKSLVDNPQVIETEKIVRKLIFRNEPLSKVFEILEEMYGVQISYEQNALINCSLTADLSDIPSLNDKLTIICKSMGGSYVVTNATIVISSSGCK